MNDQTALIVDTTIYPKTSIFRACYKFTDRAYIFLSTDSPNRIAVSFTAKPGGEDLQRIIGDFSNELIDQALREVLDERFGPIRNLIVAQAFSEGNLLEDTEKEGSTENA